MLEQLSKNITRQGLTNVTLNYLRVSDIKREHVTDFKHQTRDCLLKEKGQSSLGFMCQFIFKTTTCLNPVLILTPKLISGVNSNPNPVLM